MKIELTAVERTYLKGLAHSLNPVVMIGNNGLTDSVIREIAISLDGPERGTGATHRQTAGAVPPVGQKADRSAQEQESAEGPPVSRPPATQQKAVACHRFSFARQLSLRSRYARPIRLCTR